MPCLAPAFESERPPLSWVLAWIFSVVAAVLAAFSWTGANRCEVRRLRFRARHVGTGNRRTALDLDFDLHTWLTDRPQIANAIVWQSPQVPLTTLAYPEWESPQQDELSRRFRAIYQEEYDDPLPDAPPAVFDRPGNGYVIERTDAWRMFITYVAHALAVEVRQAEAGGRLVSWSLTSLDAQQLCHLLDSRSLFTYGPRSPHYLIRSDPHGAAVPGDPVRTFAFLRDNGLIGDTIRDTTMQFMDWSRANLRHVANPETVGYNYNGHHPVERVLAGVVGPTGRLERPVDGCWGMGGILRVVLRTANIPVELVNRVHCMPHFLADGTYLSHGDDIYGAVRDARPQPPISEYPISRAQFLAWFGDQDNVLPPAPHHPEGREPNNAVGLRMVELAARYLPPTLMYARCNDRMNPALNNGTTISGSAVYRVMSARFSIEDIRAMNLFGQLDDKIAMHPDGCRHYLMGGL